MMASTDRLRSYRTAPCRLGSSACWRSAGKRREAARRQGGGAEFRVRSLDVGIAQGFFAKAGLEIDAINFGGGAKQQQALIAGAIDIALGGGTDMAFIAKGAPEIPIATITEEPGFLGISIGAPSTARSADDLKGK
jgi:NMT1/THI5 like